MNAILRKRTWLRWAMLLPVAALYADSSCAVTDAMRNAADGLNNAASSLDGKKPSETNQLIDDIQKLFD
jgi:hypothetical protein